jgi:bifunctional non-homologous end joining protein LigD
LKEKGAEGAHRTRPSALPSLADRIRKELMRLGAPKSTVRARDVGLLLAETREKPFSEKGWIFELKYDGYRVLAAREGSRALLRYRRGSDAAEIFPEVTRAVAALPCGDLVMDGEVVVLEEDGKPSFEKLRKRSLLQRGPEIARAAAALPASYYAFDLLGFEDRDLRSLPLLERKALLREILPRAGPLRYSDEVAEHGVELFEEIRRRGLEGIVAKKAQGQYVAGRSGLWLKIRFDRTGDFVIVGLSAPRGSRSGFGALHIAQPRGGELVYAGRVGSGFSAEDLAEIHELVRPYERPEAAFEGAPKGPGNVWVEPRLLCEVRYKEWTAEGLRHAVFLRLREDKPLHGLEGAR